MANEFSRPFIRPVGPSLLPGVELIFQNSKVLFTDPTYLFPCFSLIRTVSRIADKYHFHYSSQNMFNHRVLNGCVTENVNQL